MNDVAERAFRRHYGTVYRYIRRRTHDHDRAEELTRQVFSDAAASLRETGSPPLAWLYTVAKRRFADEARREAQAGALAIAAAPDAETRKYGGKTIDGFDLVDRGGGGSLTIHELSQPDEPLAWRHIPRGSIAIEQGQSDDQNGISVRGRERS